MFISHGFVGTQEKGIGSSECHQKSIICQVVLYKRRDDGDDYNDDFAGVHRCGGCWPCAGSTDALVVLDG